MISGNRKFLRAILFTAVALSCSKMDAGSPSTWTGDGSSQMQFDFNWDNDTPTGGLAIFDGNGDNAPIANQTGPLTFDEMEFIADTEVSIITLLEASGSAGIVANPGISANFAIYEHQYPFFDPAALRVSGGPAGDGGGAVIYSLEGYGQLYATSGSTGETTVDVIMTLGNNYFEIDSVGENLFDNVSSDDSSDEIALFSGANLTIRGSNSNIINGSITGTGSLTKTGTGILTLSNDNTYNGNTLVSEGTLILNGSVAADLTLDLGAMLKGTGTIGGSLISSGTVAPGSSIGTLFVTNFLPTDSSVYEAEVTGAGLSDQIVATGAANIAGTLDVIPLDLSFTAPQTYNIVHAGALTGTFSAKTSSSPALMKLDYGANDVLLTYLPLSVIGLGHNALAGADCFVTLSGSDPDRITAELLSLPFSEIENAFNHMQPSQFSAQTWNQLSNALLIRSGYSKHLGEFSVDDACCGPYNSSVWIDTTGQWQHQGSKGSQFGYRDATGGVSLGADTCYKHFKLGAAASYTYSHLHWKESAGHGQINSYYAGLYGGWSDVRHYVDIAVLGSYNRYRTTRHIEFGNIDRRASSKHNGWETLAGIGAGVFSVMKHFKVGPFARVDYVYLSQQGYQESGAKSLDLKVNSRQDQLIQSQAGVTFTGRYLCGNEKNQGTLVPRLELSYINQTPLGRSHYYAHFGDSNCEFNVSGWNFNHNLGAVGASLGYLTSAERFGITAEYDGQFGTRYWNQSGTVVFNINY